MPSIGFTGTSRAPLTYQQRGVLRLELLRRAADNFRQGTLHLGDAIHADKECYDIAFNLEQPLLGRMYSLIDHPPINPKARAFCKYDFEHTPREYIERDDEIIAWSDEIIACPRGFQEERRSGTWTVIRHALRAGKLVLIIWPDGRTQEGKEYFDGR